MLGIEPRLAKCKANALPAVLLLQLHKLLVFKSDDTTLRDLLFIDCDSVSVSSFVRKDNGII